MTKTDFAELKEKLGKFDGHKSQASMPRLYEHIDRVDLWITAQQKQHTKSAAIISELIEIIQSQSEAIQNINNKSGIDIKMVEYETVWGDPNNVKQTLEITQKVREKHFTEICSTLSETTARLQKLRDGK